MLKRQVVFLTPEQLERLKERQAELGLPTLSDLVRRIIDEWRKEVT